MALTLQNLRDLLLVAEHGSLRAAARAAGCSQAGLTKSLQSLERELGAALMTRSASGAAPTAIGERVLARARLIEHECSRLRDDVAQAQGESTGSLSVGASPAAAVLLVPQALRELGRHYPLVQVRLATAVYEGILPRLRAGEFDFAISPVPPEGVPPDVEPTFLFRSQHAIVAHRDHPLRQARRLAELVDARWAVIGSPGAPGGSITLAFGAAGLGEPRIAAICESLTQVFALLADKDVVASLPRVLLERGFAGEGIVEVRIADRLPAFDVCLLRRRDAHLTPAAQTMASVVVSYASILMGRRPRERGARGSV